jgi:glycosyltransferase involved in cell wall biosynthesis
MYLCSWGKNREKAWSGTSYSLFKALQKKCDVEEIDMSLTKTFKFFLNVLNLRMRNGRLKINTSYRKLTTIVKQKKLNKIIRNKDDLPKLLLEDYGEGTNLYFYTDLTIGSVLRIYEDKPEIKKYVNFSYVPDRDLQHQNKYQKRIFMHSKGIFTMSQWLADFLINHDNFPKEKVHAVGGGINLDLNQLRDIQKTNNKVLFVGRDFLRKGGDLVIDAFKILKREFLPNAELYIVGPSKRLKIQEEGVIFLGDLNSDQLSKYYNRCDIFCMPSRFEAYGLVFIEALVFGLPCIARDAFAMKEFVIHGVNGYLINNDDPLVLAERMRDLLQNERIKNNVLGKRNYYINEYSWDTVADRILKVIESE